MSEQPLSGGAAFWAARGVRIEPEFDDADVQEAEAETGVEAEAEVADEAPADEVAAADEVVEAEVEAQVEPEAEQVDAPEPEAEPEPEPELELEPEPEVEPEAETAPADVEPEADPEPEPELPTFPQQRSTSTPATLSPATPSPAAIPTPATLDAADFPDHSPDGSSEPAWQLTGGDLETLPPLKTCLEAILMVIEEPTPVVTLAQVLERPTAEVAAALVELAEEYTVLGRGFELREVGVVGDGSRTGWRIYSRATCAPVVERFVRDGQQAKLTQAALETLAVVAYRQPVSRSKVSAIRGVNCDGVMRTLLARGLVEEYGNDLETGAVLYQTTGYFLERMGLKSLDELPDLAPLLPSAAEADVEDFA